MARQTSEAAWARRSPLNGLRGYARRQSWEAYHRQQDQRKTLPYQRGSTIPLMERSPLLSVLMVPCISNMAHGIHGRISLTTRAQSMNQFVSLHSRHDTLGEGSGTAHAQPHSTDRGRISPAFGCEPSTPLPRNTLASAGGYLLGTACGRGLCHRLAISQPSYNSTARTFIQRPVIPGD